MPVYTDNRVMVTGIGIIVSNGKNQQDFFDNCCKGISGLKKCTLFDVSNFSTAYAGEITDEYLYEEKSPNEKGRIEYLIETSINELLYDSGLTKEYIANLKDKAYLSEKQY